MKKNIQIAIQLIFLAIFVLLLVVGKVQIWMGIFLAGVLISIFLGRLYCGYVCPINSVMQSISLIKRKLHIKSFKVPGFLQNPVVRILMLAFFILTFVIVVVGGKKLPVLPILAITGILSTLFFPEKLFHRFLCPYGTVLSFATSRSIYSVKINPNLCNNCSACARVCPAKAIDKDDKSHLIEKKECISCMKCENVCAQNAIKYKG